MAWIESIGDVATALGAGHALKNFFSSSPDYEEIAEQNRKWQSEENQKNRDWQSSEWQRQFDLTNEYNDPSNQVARLARAGINPALAFQGASGQVGQSSASPSAPSGASTSVTSPIPDALFTRDYQSAEAFSRSVEALSRLGANQADRPLKEAATRNLLTQASHEEVKQQLSEFDYQMKLIYGDALENAKVNQAVANYQNILSDTLLKAAQTGYYNNEALVSAARKLVLESEEELNHEQLKLLRTELKFAPQRLQAMIDYYNATARNQSEQAEQTAFWNSLYRDEREYLVKNIHNDAAQKFQNAKMSEEQRDLLRFHISQARYADDNKEIKFWNDLITQDLGLAADIAGDLTRMASFRALSKSQQDKVKLDEEKFRYDTETFEDTYNRYDAAGRKHIYKGRRKLDGTNWMRQTND